MSSTKEYKIKLTAEKDTSGFAEAEKDVRSFMSALMLINAPFRVYGMLLRDNNRLQDLFGASTEDATAAMGTQVAGYTAESTAIADLNDELGTQVVLEGTATPEMVPEMAAGAAAATALVGEAAGAGAVASLQTGGVVTKGGLAEVDEGETFSGIGGGGGGPINITNNIMMDPAGLDFNDFTDKLNESMRLGLRSHTRNIPS